MHQRSGTASRAQEVDQQVEHLGMKNGRCFEMLSRCGGAGKNENARANDRADAERGQRPRPQRFAKTMLRLLGLGYEFVDGFTTQELAAIGSRGRIGGG